MKAWACGLAPTARQSAQMLLRGSGGGSLRRAMPGVSGGRLPSMYKVHAAPAATMATVS
jgi:hypothetical protein